MQDWEKWEGTNLDPEGELVTTQRWPQFQKDLRRWHHQLGLCWDRRYRRWSLYRRDLEQRRLAISQDETLTYMHPIYTVVMPLEWFTEDEQYMPVRHYREPGEWVFRDLVQMHPAQLGCDNTEWLAKYTKQWGEEKYEKSQADAERLSREVVQDAMSSASKTNPTWDKTHHTVPEMPT